MIPFKIRSTTLSAYVFDKNEGVTVLADMDTVRRWKRAHDTWISVQGEMAAAAKSNEPEPPAEPLNHKWEGLPKNPAETVVFDSRSYMGSGIPNGVPVQQQQVPHEQPKQLPVPAEVGGPAADLRQPDPPKRKRGRPRSKVAGRPAYEEAPTGEVALT